MNTRNKIETNINRKERGLIMTLQPIGDNIILKISMKQKEEKTSGGLLLLNQGTEQSLREDMATVYAIGEGRLLNNGVIIEPKVKIGDKVLYNKFAGTEIIDDNQKYLIVRENDLLAIIK